MERGVAEGRLWNAAEAARELLFRAPMPVRKALLFRSGETYPVCPKCGVTLEREYQNFCDRCGQRLDWTRFHRAVIVTKF